MCEILGFWENYNIKLISKTTNLQFSLSTANLLDPQVATDISTTTTRFYTITLSFDISFGFLDSGLGTVFLIEIFYAEKAL